MIETPDLLADHRHRCRQAVRRHWFAGNGMTFGTLGGDDGTRRHHGREAIPGASSSTSDRSLVRRGPWKYLTENLDYPYYLVRDRFAGASTRSLRSIRRNELATSSTSTALAVAAYRNEKGKLITLSPVCTHLGCQVHWNATEGVVGMSVPRITLPGHRRGHRRTSGKSARAARPEENLGLIPASSPQGRHFHTARWQPIPHARCRAVVL